MEKQKAIDLLGGSVKAAAKALGVSYQAVDKWPDQLSPRVADRVLGAYARISAPAFAAAHTVARQKKSRRTTPPTEAHHVN